MSFQIVLSFITFVFVSGITPGPANLTSLATSLQYGRKPAFRQWIGFLTGCMTDAMISTVIVYFVGTALNDYVKYLAFVGFAYLVYLSIHMLRMNYDSEQKEIKEPGFWRGYTIQLTNVKIILTCITALSSYVLPNSQSFPVLLVFGVMLGVIQPTCNLAWVFTGLSLQKLFIKYSRIINIIMAAALFVCAISLALVPFTH